MRNHKACGDNKIGAWNAEISIFWHNTVEWRFEMRAVECHKLLGTCQMQSTLIKVVRLKDHPEMNLKGNEICEEQHSLRWCHEMKGDTHHDIKREKSEQRQGWHMKRINVIKSWMQETRWGSGIGKWWAQNRMTCCPHFHAMGTRDYRLSQKHASGLLNEWFNPLHQRRLFDIEEERQESLRKVIYQSIFWRMSRCRLIPNHSTTCTEKQGVKDQWRV